MSAFLIFPYLHQGLGAGPVPTYLSTGRGAHGFPGTLRGVSSWAFLRSRFRTESYQLFISVKIFWALCHLEAAHSGGQILPLYLHTYITCFNICTGLNLHSTPSSSTILAYEAVCHGTCPNRCLKKWWVSRCLEKFKLFFSVKRSQVLF